MTPCRVVTWNLWWRFGDWARRFEVIAAVLAEAAPDVVGLQEVWARGSGADSVNAAGLLATRLGMHWAWVPSPAPERWQRKLDDASAFGNAVLSRWPIVASDVLALPSTEDTEELRTCVRADLDGPRGALQVFSTHLNWRFDQSDVRQEQVRAICGFIDAAKPEGGRAVPPILAGDFNADPESDEIRMLTGRAATPVAKLVFHDAWEVAGQASDSSVDGATWTNTNPYAKLDLEPDRRIDFVFVGWPKAGGVGHVTRCSVEGLEPVDGVVPSDHLAVLAEIRY